jgi:hypothetical protein
MKLQRPFAALFVMLALAGCAEVAMRQGPAPYAPYSAGSNGEYPRDRGGDGGGGGGGSGM